MTYSAPSRHPLAALWLILFGIVLVLAYLNAFVIQRLITLGWPEFLATRGGVLLPLFPVLSLACLPFLANSAQHFTAFGRKVVVIKDGKLYRAGYHPIELAEIVDVFVQEGRYGPWAMVKTRSGRRHFVSPWFAGPDIDSVCIGVRRALEHHRVPAERPS